MCISVQGPEYIELLEKEEDSRLFYVVDLLLPISHHVLQDLYKNKKCKGNFPLEILSRKLIAPSSPSTEPYLQKTPISFSGQIAPSLYFPRILFYPAEADQEHAPVNNNEEIKKQTVAAIATRKLNPFLSISRQIQFIAMIRELNI
uniref:Uncharacterized protein n=1 Tax=Salix viminalis TaxID=40686 RepID=A0A6N2MMR7_SALVM